MKSILLAGLLLGAGPVLAQQAYKGPEVSAPARRVETIILHSTDSARVAYAKATKALLAAGYGIDKTDKDALFLSTPPKLLDGGVSLILQLVVSQTATGSDATIRGVFTWVSAITTMARTENQQHPVQYIGAGSNPTQRAWAAMQSAAVTALPGARVGYK